ncbi:MAG TPA: CPBP family glutamic-type intramembrane protease [Candidatus Acidoferrales bacterium]|nr:CPBP family glutamic-type intramembrane protease [Candidatus Acidoferrales bacterium]
MVPGANGGFGLRKWLAVADVTLFPAFVLWFIWRLEFVARWTWIVFPVWLIASFLLHGDTHKTLGWRLDNLRPATKQDAIIFGVMAAALVGTGLATGAPPHLPRNTHVLAPFAGYLAFCTAQQLGLNCLVHNRMLSLIRNEWLSALLSGIIFAACHWPNPVLIPLTFVGGAVMAWMFGRARNVIPLAIGQAILGILVAWAFPIAWHHHMRVGPGYYTWRG